MKYFISIIIFSAFLFTSCGSSQAEEEKSSGETELTIDKSTESEDSAEAKRCVEYIDKYEVWMDNYIKLLEKYVKNPTDIELMKEFMKLDHEGDAWIIDWNAKFSYCASQKKYHDRIIEIAKKAEKKLKELRMK